MAQLAISKKDLSIALEIAENVNSPVPVTKQIFKLFNEAYENGWGDLDHSAIMKLYEKMENER